MVREVECEHDRCCKFEARSWNQRYCPQHRCKRKAENAARALEDAELFEQPLEYSVLKITDLPDGYKVMITNDEQRPFQDDVTLEAVDAFAADFMPDLEIYNGDMFDMYSISDFDKNPSRLFNLQGEVDACVRRLDQRRTANPGARMIFIDGNHEDRLRRYLWRRGSDISSLRALQPDNLFGFPERNIEHLNYRSCVDLLGFRIEHGYLAPGTNSAYPLNVSRAMASKTGSSGLCGHTHRFSVYSWTDTRGTHSYVENGCLCRPMEYAAFPNWQQAFTYGIVQKGKIHLFPTQIYETGFMAGGEFYPRVTRRRQGRRAA